jgi:hypothetical protein
MSSAMLNYYESGGSDSSRRCIQLLKAAGAKPIDNHPIDTSLDIEAKTQKFLALQQFDESVNSCRHTMFQRNMPFVLDQGIKKAGKTLPFVLLLEISDYLDGDYNYDDFYERASHTFDKKKQLIFHSKMIAILMIGLGVGMFTITSLFPKTMSPGSTPMREAIKGSIGGFFGGVIMSAVDDCHKNQTKRIKIR